MTEFGIEHLKEFEREIKKLEEEGKAKLRHAQFVCWKVCGDECHGLCQGMFSKQEV